MVVRRTVVPLVATMLVALVGCGGSAQSAQSAQSAPTAQSPGGGQSQEPVALMAQQARGPAADPRAAGSAVTAVGAGLLDAVPATKNAAISPYSVYAVLAMAAAGARGETKAQLDEFLRAGTAEPGECLTAVDAAVADAVASGAPSKGDPAVADTRPMTVRSANSLWADRGLTVRPEYLDRLARGFGTGMYQVNYRVDPEVARRAINSWVDDRTATLIPELIPRDKITRDTVLTLVNAVYLNAPWATEFLRPAGPSTFTTADGRTVSVPLMSQTAGYAHAAGRGWTSVTIPYRGDRLAMTVIIPDAGRFDQVRANLPAVLDTATTASAAGPVALSLPGFTVDTALSLSDQLRAARVTDLFDPRSVDLSGIAGDPGYLVATDLVHRAVVKVDEKGTEAAAATAMVFEATGALAEPLPITVDRSFIFAVHDVSTGAPLFLGQVIDPTA